MLFAWVDISIEHTICCHHFALINMFGCISAVILIVILYCLLERWYRRGFIPDFSTKHVFITGTDTGFGQTLAINLDKMGVHVYAGCYTEEGIRNLKNLTSRRLKTLPLDITDQDSVDRAKEFVENDLPPGQHLWGLVNNAGIVGNVCFQLTDIADYRRVMEVNFFGHVRVTEAFAPLVQKARGRIVNVISMCGRISLGNAPYTSSKQAFEPYTDGLRRYMRPFGVKVAALEPGFFLDTNIMGHDILSELTKKWEALPECKKNELGENFVQKIKYHLDLVLNYWPFRRLNNKSMVVDDMTHALGAKHPKARYVCGYDARPLIWFCTCSPDWLQDAIFGFQYRL